MIIHDRFNINTSKVVHETMDNEVIIINFETGNYYSMNSTAKDIWHCLENSPSLNDLVDDTAHRYDAAREEIKMDLLQFLKELLEENLVAEYKEEMKGSPGGIKFQNDNPNGKDNGEDKLKYQKPGFRKYTDMKEMLLLDPIHDVDETGWPYPKKPLPKKD
jgi:hypothetical protein